MGREFKIALVIGALLCGVAAGVLTSMTPDSASEAATETATSEPAAAAAPEAPEQEVPATEKVQPGKNSHVRLSNVEMLRPDFTKIVAPKRDVPTDEQSE